MRNGNIMGHVGSTQSSTKNTAGTPIGARKNSSKDDVTARSRYAQMKQSQQSYKEQMQQRIRDFQTEMIAEGTKNYGHIAGIDADQPTEYSDKTKATMLQMAEQKARKQERKREAKAAHNTAQADKQKTQPLNWIGQGTGGGALSAKKQSFSGTMWEKKQWQLDAEERKKRGD